MSQWFRLYNELLDDPKIQKLPASLFRDWINLLCLASRNEGFLPPIQDVSFALRMSEAACETTIQSLQKHGLIDKKAGTFKPHNWDARQYKSDTSTERVKRFRKRQRNVTETASVTDQIQSRTDTEQIQNRTETEGRGIPPAEHRGGRRDEAADIFSASYLQHIGNPYGWLKGDFEQLSRLRKRLNLGTTETPADWEPAIVNYFASPFAEFSLHHFAAKFDTFKNSPLDRFHTPVNHEGAKRNGGLKENPNERAAADYANRSMAKKIRGNF